MTAAAGLSPPEYLRLFEEEAWYRGEIDYLLKEHSQKLIFRQVEAWRARNPLSIGPVVLNCHRGMGKSFFLLEYAIQWALRTPGQIVRFAAPTYKQTNEIAEPILKLILSHCPAALHPEKSGAKYTFKNPRWPKGSPESLLYLVSCKDDADSQRGLRSDLICIDECRDVSNFEYVVGDVFNFHFATREAPLMILSSTPPGSLEHPWWAKYLMEAQSAKDPRYFVLSTEDNPEWSLQDDQRLADACGGKETSAWKREALCRLEPDPTKLIVPEWQKVKGNCVREWPRPGFFQPYLCIDSGFIDKTACLFGYIDFENEKLVIEHERILRRATSEELGEAILEVELDYYSTQLTARESVYFAIRRVADMTPQQVADLHKEIRALVADPKRGFKAKAGDGYPFSILPVDKRNNAQWYEPTSRTRMRAAVGREQIVINPRCKGLIAQLDVGTQDDKGNFERSLEHGHFDAIAALNYLYRSVNFQFNPFPVGQPGRDQFVNPWMKKESTGPVVTHNRPMILNRRPY